MPLRVALLVDAEFLRMVLCQLLRKMAFVALSGEATTPAAALRLPTVDAMIADVGPCVSDAPGFASLCRMYAGRMVLIGDGDTVARPGLTVPADVVQVPMGSAIGRRDLSRLGERLEHALRSLAPGNLGREPPCPRPQANSPRSGRLRRPELILVAASTGGPEALQEWLGALHPPVCPIVIALHIPAEHCGGLANHLSAMTGHEVTVGVAAPLPAAGVVLLQGGIDHQVVVRDGGFWLRRAAPAGSVFHPNGDILLGSGAVLADRWVVGIVLTGMGNDGCAGAAALAARGFPVLAQTPASCAVPGMPAAAIAAGAVREAASLTGIADRLNTWFSM